jgi:B9 domain-containing protein 2
MHGRHSIAGYGNITFPLAPGDYNLEVLTWRPEGSTYDKAMSFFLGANPELVYKDMVLSGNDRFGMQAISAGRVELRVGIIVKDFNLHGIIL